MQLCFLTDLIVTAVRIDLWNKYYEERKYNSVIVIIVLHQCVGINLDHHNNIDISSTCHPPRGQ